MRAVLASGTIGRTPNFHFRRSEPSFPYHRALTGISLRNPVHARTGAQCFANASSAMFLSAETFWAVLLSPVQPRLGAETAKAGVFRRILRHLYLPLPPRHRTCSVPCSCLSRRRRQQRGDLVQHATEEPPRQVTLRQQQPIVAGMFNQTASGFHQPLLQAGQRPPVDACRQHQPPPQVAEILSDHAKPQPHLVGLEAVARKPRHRDHLFAFLYPTAARGRPAATACSSPARQSTAVR